MAGERLLQVTCRVPLSELRTLVGRDLGPSEPVTFSQERIDKFAACTLDEQWIHVDPRKASQSPWGTTIAHGYLTLAMLSHFLGELLVVDGTEAALNYGLDRVRFPAVVPSGSQIRATATVLDVDPGPDFTAMTARITFRSDAADKPCCVADSITRYLPAAAVR
jgi:acyl dehydratase